jgi:hypothetical protein
MPGLSIQAMEKRSPAGVNTYPAVYNYGAGGINIGVTETIGMAASQRLWDTCVSVLVTNVTVLALCAVP